MVRTGVTLWKINYCLSPQFIFSMKLFELVICMSCLKKTLQFVEGRTRCQDSRTGTWAILGDLSVEREKLAKI